MLCSTASPSPHPPLTDTPAARHVTRSTVRAAVAVWGAVTEAEAAEEALAEAAEAAEAADQATEVATTGSSPKGTASFGLIGTSGGRAACTAPRACPSPCSTGPRPARSTAARGSRQTPPRTDATAAVEVAWTAVAAAAARAVASTAAASAPRRSDRSKSRPTRTARRRRLAAGDTWRRRCPRAGSSRRMGPCSRRRGRSEGRTADSFHRKPSPP